MSELQRKLTEENLRLARELFFADYSMAAIARRLKVSFAVVYRAIYGLRRAYSQGVPDLDLISAAIIRHREGAAIARRRLSSEEAQRVFELRARGVSFAAIGRRFGVSKRTIMNIVNGKIYKGACVLAL